jgi:hypothetical protein
LSSIEWFLSGVNEEDVVEEKEERTGERVQRHETRLTMRVLAMLKPTEDLRQRALLLDIFKVSPGLVHV